MLGLYFERFIFELFLPFRLIKVNIVAFGIGHIQLLSFRFVLGGRTERTKLFFLLLLLISIQGFLQTL